MLGRHPLRALATADGATPLLAPAWAEVGRNADPVQARNVTLLAMATEWQWTALPADYAREIAASGLLQKSARLVTSGGAYVASLRGRCATDAALHLAHPAPRNGTRATAQSSQRWRARSLRHPAVAGRRPGTFSPRR